MNLYAFHTDPKSLHGHARADRESVPHFWDKYKHDDAALKDRVDAIAKSTTHSFMYALHKLKAPFPEGENAIAKDAMTASMYAKLILKGPFPKGEAEIAKDASISCGYAMHVLHAPFPKGEAVIAKDEKMATSYLKAFPERRKALTKLGW